MGACPFLVLLAETCTLHSKVQFQPSFSSAKCTSRRRSGTAALEQLRRPGEKGSLSVSHRNSPGLSRRGSWREHLRRSAGFESSARLRLGGDSRADGTVDTAAGDRSRPRAAGAPAARTGGPCEGARLVVWWQFPRAPARPAAPRVIHRMCTFRRFRVSFPPVSAKGRWVSGPTHAPTSATHSSPRRAPRPRCPGRGPPRPGRRARPPEPPAARAPA